MERGVMLDRMATQMSNTLSGTLGEGAELPAVTLESGDGPLSLRALRAGRALVVCFYTEDATPTCSAQLRAFRDDFDVIDELGAAFVAISADSVASHAAFREANAFPFPLLADPELRAAKAFGVIDETGKRSVRAIFVTNEAGTIVAAIPHYNPVNGQQFQAVFEALGMDLS